MESESRILVIVNVNYFNRTKNTIIISSEIILLVIKLFSLMEQSFFSTFLMALITSFINLITLRKISKDLISFKNCNKRKLFSDKISERMKKLDFGNPNIKIGKNSLSFFSRLIKLNIWILKLFYSKDW